MATRHGHQEAFTVDPALKSGDVKNQFDHDADTLLVQVKKANEAAKVLRRKQKKIERKLQQKTSKNLQKCIEKYNNCLKDIKDAVNKMQDVLSDGGFHEKELPRKKPYHLSHEPPKRKNRPSLPMDEFSSPRTECMMCIKKDSDIKELEARLESFKRKEKEHETQLKAALQAYDKLQEERETDNFKITNRQETEMRREKDSTLQSGFEEQVRPYKAKSSLSWEGPRKQKKRSGVPFVDTKKECMNCYSKAEKIECLEVSLKQTVMDREEFKQKYQDERDQRIKYQHLYKEEQEGKEDALRRLSSIASSKLRDNNPNIADLSDQFRPTKIAEKMSELYDNQWTDAYSALEEQGLGEKQIIESLLDMFMAAFKECSRLASENFFERVQRCIEIPTEGRQPTNYKVVMPDQLKQQVKEFRKTRARFVVKEIEPMVMKRIQIENQEAVSVYLTHCIQIAWFCAVQDPPLVVRRDAPVKFDTNTYKDYTKRGKYTEFVVWPALYLHDGGAMLSKGVAQGADTTAPYNVTASKAQHVTEIQVPKSDFDGARTVHATANVLKDNIHPGTQRQQHFSRTISVKPVVQAYQGTAI